MNDLDLIRTVLDEVPEPSQARLAAGRTRLLTAIRSGAIRSGAIRSSRRIWTSRRLVVPAGLATAAAAVAAVVAVTLAGSPAVPATRPATASRPATQPAPRDTATSATLAAQVLGVAARTVASEPATEPGPHQWIYARTVATQTGQPVQYDDEWMTFDAAQSAYYQDGQLVVHTEPAASPSAPAGTSPLAAVDDTLTPLTAYNALAALPAGPARLLAAVDAELARTGQTNFGVTGAATTSPQKEFAWLGMVLWNAYEAAPRQALADVYQAIATIPGVTIDQHVTDAAKRPAIGITDDGGATELLLSQSSYQPVGLIVRTPAMKIRPAKQTPAQTDSLALVRVAEVSHPGEK